MPVNYSNTDYWKIVPSYSCNKNCSYCYNKLLNQEVSADNKEQLRVLKDILKHQQVNFVSEIIGGEPLDDINFQQTQNVIKILAEEALCKKIIITTAAYDNEKIRDISDKIDMLYLSIDIDESGEKSRINEDFIAETVEICKKKSISLCLSVTLSGSESLDDIQKFILTSYNRGISNFGFGFINFINHTKSNIERYIDIFYFLVLVKYDLEIEGVTIGGDMIDTIDFAINSQKRERICNCGDTSFVIQPNGQIEPSICYNSSLGNELNEFFLIQKKREEKLKMHDCKSCELWDFCFGGCTGNAFAVQNSLNKCDIIFCKIIKGIWEKIQYLKTTANKSYI